MSKLFSDEKTPQKFPFPEDDDEFILKDDLNVNFISVNDHNDIMISYVG